MVHAENQDQFSHRNKKRSKSFKNFSFDQNIICFHLVMNDFLSLVVFCCQKRPFPAETAVSSIRLPVLVFFINIRQNCSFQ